MKKKKILLIEDDKDHAGIVTDVIEKVSSVNSKMELLLIEDGEAAIEFFQSEAEKDIFIIILDISLPKVDGMEVLKFVRKSSTYGSVPVIVLSGSTDKKLIDDAYENGANVYLAKPDSYEDIVEMIRMLEKFDEV